MKHSLLTFLLPLFAVSVFGADKQLNTGRIDELTGLKGKLNDQEHVYKVSSPRADIKVSVD